MLVDTGLTLPPPPPEQVGRRNRSVAGTLPGSAYEVLVSVARMPIVRIDPLHELSGSEHRERYVERFTHPFSELGSYALRVYRGPGNEAFSDWRDYGPEDELLSVMSYPFRDCLLADAHDARCTPAGCPLFEERVAMYQTPTPSDLRHLNAMYQFTQSD